MSVVPYQTKSGYLYIPCKRGDGIIAPNKPEQARLRNGMCGGYIDPDDWTTPPVLSEYTQGETLWIEVPRTRKAIEFAVAAGQEIRGNAPNDRRYRKMRHWIDFAQLPAHVPSFFVDVYEHKRPIPVMRLAALPEGAIRDSGELAVDGRNLIDDVGQITAGTYTVGPGGGDNYPTFGGAGGIWAAMGNLTGTLNAVLNGDVTEAAQTALAISLNNNLLDCYSALPHYGDPTAGHLMQCNFVGSPFNFQQEGPGNTRVHGFRTRRINANNAANRDLYTSAVANAFNLYLYDYLCDGNNRRIEHCFRPNDHTVNVYLWNAIGWDADADGLYVDACNSNLVAENCLFYNCNTNGVNGGGFDFVARNIACYGNGTDFANIGGATGRYCRSADNSAANGNWNAGVGNTTGAVAANDVQSVDDTQSTFFDLVSGGPLDGAGEANSLTRTMGIRGRAVPGPNGTSIGPAEAPAPSDTGISPAILHGTHIGISRMGVGLY